MALSSVQLLAVRERNNGTPVLRRAFSNSPILHRSYLSGPNQDFRKNSEFENLYLTQKRIKIIVSGTTFETLESTLGRFPETLLGNKSTRDLHYDVSRKCLFFQRCPISFEAILFYYQSPGYLIRPSVIRMEEFEQECFLFKLENEAILRMKEREGYARHEPPKPKAEVKTCLFRLHSFLEYPESSKLAGVFALLSMMMIVGSVFMACISTLPSIAAEVEASTVLGNPLSLTEFIMNIFFTLEYTLRFMSSPKKLRFLISPLNAIDFLAAFPYFVVFAIDEKHVSNLRFIKAFRTVRALRLLRFSRHSDTLRVVINILSSSVRDLFTVVFCMLLMSIAWGSLAFYIEVGSTDTQFSSILDGMWWAIQTIVCLGYGDIIPVTFPGKVAASAVAVIGALTLTVPLLSIGGRYLQMYSRTFSIQNTTDTKDKESEPTKHKPRAVK